MTTYYVADWESFRVVEIDAQDGAVDQWNNLRWHRPDGTVCRTKAFFEKRDDAVKSLEVKRIRSVEILERRIEKLQSLVFA